MDRASTHGLIAEHIKGSGRITRCKEMVTSAGPMAEITWGSIMMIRKKDSAYLPGQTKESTQDIGKMESRMVLAYTHLQRGRQNLGNGQMERE
jgi:hypothetical protein